MAVTGLTDSGIDGAAGLPPADSAVADTLVAAADVGSPLPSSCAETCKGCCLGTECSPGGDGTACGLAGEACQNCSAEGQECVGNACQAPPACSAQNCQGCCDAEGKCEAGFIDDNCGAEGAGCVDCTALASPSTCDVGASPRVCTSPQTQCPAIYAGCPVALSMPPPAQRGCTDSDIQNAAAACAGGAHAQACQAFFQFEGSDNNACAACLVRFDFDFSELKGLVACLSPFTDPACSHDLACLTDCQKQSCSACADPGSAAACQNVVLEQTCGLFAVGSVCVQGALSGAGNVCNPLQFVTNFGGWLATVGAYFCE